MKRLIFGVSLLIVGTIVGLVSALVLGSSAIYALAAILCLIAVLALS